jgi:hypothetical protein
VSAAFDDWNPSAELDIRAEKWAHEDGDRIWGLVVNRDVYYSSEYGPSPTVTLRIEKDGPTENGGQPIPVPSERIIYASSTVLSRLVESQDPQPGDMWAVVYRGKATGKSGTPYHDYNAKIRKSPDNVKAEAKRKPAPAKSTEPEAPATTETESAQTDDIPF